MEDNTNTTEDAGSGKRLFVGNISYNSSNDSLKAAFEQFGTVESAEIKYDRDNRSKGFGFVEMGNPEEAQAAIEGMNGKELDGRQLTVNVARPRPVREELGNFSRAAYIFFRVKQ
jgi:RNA recognition motif-containing protein